MSFRFGDEIKMLRPYDDGRYVAGEVYTVAVPGEPEDGRVMPGVAQSLCREGNDGRGPYAERVGGQDEDENEGQLAVDTDETVTTE